MIESIPRYKKMCLTKDEVMNSLNMQVIAKFIPSRVTWPKEPWEAKGFDKILKDLRDGV